MIFLDDLSLKFTCLMVNYNYACLWHRRIAHIHMDHLNKLVKHDLVVCLPKIKYINKNYVMHVKKVISKLKYLSNLGIFPHLPHRFN